MGGSGAARKWLEKRPQQAMAINARIPKREWLEELIRRAFIE
jgi:hypothetical protein